MGLVLIPSISTGELFRRLNKLISVKCLEQGLAFNTHDVYLSDKNKDLRLTRCQALCSTLSACSIKGAMASVLLAQLHRVRSMVQRLFEVEGLKGRSQVLERGVSDWLPSLPPW